MKNLIEEIWAWINRPFNIRHWALRILSRGAPTLLNAVHENGSLVIKGDHAYIHGLTIIQPPAVKITEASKVTISGTNIIGGAITETSIKVADNSYIKLNG